MRSTRVTAAALSLFGVIACASCSLLADFSGLTSSESMPSGSGGAGGAASSTSTGHPHGGGTSTTSHAGGAGTTTSTGSAASGGGGAAPATGTGGASTSSTGGGGPNAAVQSGVATLPANVDTIAATLPVAVDPSKSVLFFSLSVDDPAPANSQVSGALTGPTTLTFARAAAAGPAVDVAWYVAQFASGVSVQRGEVVLDANASHDVLISAVSRAHAFPIVSKRVSGGTYDYNDFTRAEITSSTNLNLSLELAGGDAGGTVEWQVVEYLGANVQSGTIAFDDAVDTMRSVPLSPNVDPTKSLLVFSNSVVRAHTAAAPSVSGYAGRILDAANAAFERNAVDTVAGTDHLTYYVVDFVDGTSVQSGTSLFNGDATQMATLTAVDSSRAVPLLFGRSGRGGRSAYATDGNTGAATFSITLGGPTEVDVTRALSASTATADWAVVEFR